MEYNAVPFGEIWQDGIFTVPNRLFDKYIKLTSEYQLKALLFILRNNGRASAEEIAQALSQDIDSIVDIMEFWCDEGIIAVNGKLEAASPIVEKEQTEKPAAKSKDSSVPRLSRRDIAIQLKSSKLLSQLVSQAQLVMCRPLADGEVNSIINMVNYYGLPAEVVMMILEYYRSELQKGLRPSFSYIDKMAKNWADEGITTIEDADEKLMKIERSNKRWNEVIAIAGIKRKQPTDKQRNTVNEWFNDFDISMITLAAEIMNREIMDKKKMNPEEDVAPSVQYMDNILKKWKKYDIKTVDAAIKYQEDIKNKRNKTSDKMQRAPSYDLDEIKRRALENNDIV